jgi:carbon storage regulator CsrA
MLVLTRRVNEKVVFPAIDASVQVVSVKAGVVRLGIQAPREVVVLREEVLHREAEGGQGPCPAAASLAVATQLRKMNDLLRNRLKIATTGLAVAQHQLQAGLTHDAEATLASIQDDLQLLAQRVDGELKKKPRQRPVPKHRKALLVEDDRNERELLAGFLRRAGLDVATAGDGTDALDYLRSRERPDVVLMDMAMPRCDGPTAVRAIRSDPALKGLKIFAVTGHLPEEFDITVGPGGIDRWFHKPLDPEVLVRDLDRELK